MVILIVQHVYILYLNIVESLLKGKRRTDLDIEINAVHLSPNFVLRRYLGCVKCSKSVRTVKMIADYHIQIISLCWGHNSLSFIDCVVAGRKWKLRLLWKKLLQKISLECKKLSKRSSPTQVILSIESKIK